MNTEIISRDATDITKEYYTDYSRYVLETRALPSVVDGLKMVQRRIIYTASKYPDKLVKTANLSGECLKYHPHGDPSGAIVTIANPTTNLPIFDTKGNFGGYGYGASASRYTECKLSEIGRFIYTQFVDFAPMIQGEIGLMEPEYLPTMLPYALVEGANGIGVGLSTNIVPLNLMDLIDYYIEYIKTEKFSDTLVIRPEFRSMIVHLSEEDAIASAKEYKGWYDVSSIVKQESDNIFVVEALYGKSIDRVLKQLSWWIDSDKVDFRNESKKTERYVFEITDQSVDKEEFVKYLKKATRKRQTFNRVMVDGDTAVYCSLDYVVKRSLEGLNKAIDNMIDYYKSKYSKQLKIYEALNILKKSKVLKSLTSYTTDEVVDLLVSYKVDEEIARELMRRPISYLTKSHNDEYEDTLNKLNDLENHNRKEYLVNLYNKLKDLLTDFYNSRSHSVLESSVIEHPQVKLISDNKLMISEYDGTGVVYDSIIYLVGKSGCIYKRFISSSYSSELDTNTDSDPIISIISDKYRYAFIKTAEDTYGLIVDLHSLKYDKKVINLAEGEVISSVAYLTDIDSDQAYLVKSRASKSVKL